MSWLDRCYETYESNRDFIGDSTKGRVLLLPVGHTTQKINVEVRLSEAGDFLDARVLRPDEMTTIIPCTEASSSRTSGAVPHPLADKLQYVAGDYTAYGGKKKSCFTEYIQQLGDWCRSEYADSHVQAVWRYLQKGCLIHDLVSVRVLRTELDDPSHLMKRWTGDKNEMPAIFQSVTGGDQSEAFVRFTVAGNELCNDKAVWKSFQQFEMGRLSKTDYCYIEGKTVKVSSLAPYKIRNAGDRAKLISSNDSTNFTYRGRFHKPDQAFSVGYDVTQKVHSALRWLIGLQGIQFGDETILVWGTENEPVPRLGDDTLSFVTRLPESVENTMRQLDEEEDWDEEDRADAVKITATRSAFAKQFNLAIQGYRHKLTARSKVSVIVLDSAVPGRMAIRYYRELSGSRLMDHIKDWHTQFSWLLDYRRVEEKGEKKKYQRIIFEGAPSPDDIVKAAYGDKADDKLRRQTIERILPCIAEGKSFPKDIMRAAVRRAVNGISLDPYECMKVRSIACALIHGFYTRCKINKEVFSMRVRDDYTDRSYLFGRILACAEQTERHAQALTTADKKELRSTNAERLMAHFVAQPAKTLLVLRMKLDPYINKIKSKTGYDSSRYEKMLELISRIPLDQLTNEPLDEKFLVGYASQKIDFIEEKRNKDKSIAIEDKD